MADYVVRNYQIQYTIISPSGERYTPTEIMIYTCSAKKAIEVVCKNATDRHYNQLTLF